MGKSALIMTLGLSLIIAFIILKLNTNATQGVETTVNKFDQTHARLIANSAVEIQLEKLRQDKNLHGNFAGSLFDGSYSGNISPEDANGRIIIRSTGLFQTISHYVRVDAERKSVTAPPSAGAVRIITNVFDKLIISGGLNISGFDHDPTGVRIDSLPAIPGITVDTQGQIDTLVDKKLGINANAEVTGLGPLVKDKYSIALPSGEEVDWLGISEDIASSADTILYGGSGDKFENFPNFSIGTLANPKIVRIEGNVQINSANATGAGILVVNGNLTLEKLFWQGYIVAYKDSKIDIKLNGGATVIGGMLLSGDTVEITAGNGGFTLKYSSQVMQLLHENLVSSRFKILNWWE
ncbi:MAG TPA: hypothetical protein DHV28_06485 [Ignavibacteriales bacterium]|nr:hypothetical protein [Ignavibacteriales bacterium]